MRGASRGVQQAGQITGPGNQTGQWPGGADASRRSRLDSGVPRACLASTAREVLGRGPGLLRGSAVDRRLDAAQVNGGKPSGWRAAARACARKNRPETQNRRGGRAARGERDRPARAGRDTTTTPRLTARPRPSSSGRTCANLGLIESRDREAHARTHRGCLTFESDDDRVPASDAARSAASQIRDRSGTSSIRDGPGSCSAPRRRAARCAASGARRTERHRQRALAWPHATASA